MPNKAVTLLSFSFRRGLPDAADMVLDARFLKNPFYDPALTSTSGLDQPAGDYIETDPNFAPFFKNLTALLSPLLPRYLEREEGFTLAIGCTGGIHRSVYTVEKLAGFLRDEGYIVTVGHRDLKA